MSWGVVTGRHVAERDRNVVLISLDSLSSFITNSTNISVDQRLGIRSWLGLGSQGERDVSALTELEVQASGPSHIYVGRYAPILCALSILKPPNAPAASSQFWGLSLISLSGGWGLQGQVLHPLVLGRGLVCHSSDHTEPCLSHRVPSLPIRLHSQRSLRSHVGACRNSVRGG